MLVGVPIKVAVPPIEAAYAIYNNKGIAKFLFSTLFWLEKNAITEVAIGSIIIVVAVLLIHIDKKAVDIINPNTIKLGPALKLEIIKKAILLCKFVYCIAKPKMNPPKKRKIIGWA